MWRRTSRREVRLVPLPGRVRGLRVAAALEGMAERDLRPKVAIKRLPQVMRDRLPTLMPGLFELVGPDLQLVQGPTSITALMTSEAWRRGSLWNRYC